jgi:hypothetical protein
MKKVILAMMIAAFAKVSVQAQTTDKTNEFYFTVNAPQSGLERRVLEVYSGITTADFFRWLGFAMVGLDTRRIRPFQEEGAYAQQATTVGVPFSVGFRKNMTANGGFQMGLRYSNRIYQVQHFHQWEASTYNREMFNSLELELNGNWMRTRYIDCYSGLSIGSTMHHVTGNNKVILSHVTSHLNILGVRYKQGRSNVNLEFGVGSRGVAALGVGRTF